MILFLRALKRGLLQITQHPGLHVMAASALALTCFLAGAFGMFLYNLDHHLYRHQGSAQFQLYWKPGTDPAQVRRQLEGVRAMEGVRDTVFFTPDQALESLKKTLGPGYDFSWLGGVNPMPATALVLFAVTSPDTREARQLLEGLRALPGVDKVRASPMQLDVAMALRGLSLKALLPLSVSLSLVIAMVAYFSARLSLEGQRAEVEIMRLVGAKEWFVRLPWAVSAMLTGLAGSLVGLGALRLLQVSLGGALYEAPLWISLYPLPLGEALVMGFMALAMSGLGGWLAARE